MNFKNKRGDESSTLVWIFAIFVILFILVIFIGVAFSMGISKTFIWESGIKENGILYTGDNALSQNLFSILNSEIEMNGKKQKAIISIMESYDVYLSDGLNENVYAMNNNLANQLKKVMDEYCSSYKLVIPQGMITEEGKINYNGQGEMFYKSDDFSKGEWAMIVQFPFNYKGKIILFQFTELKACSPYQRVGSQEAST